MSDIKLMRLTAAAKAQILNTLAEEGYIDIRIERLSNDKISVIGEHDGLPVLQILEAEVKPGGSVTLRNLKMKLEIGE